jgi:hypothetical protein
MVVSRVRDWSYSSFHRYARQGLLAVDWAGDLSADGRAYGERADGPGYRFAHPGYDLQQ